MVGPRPYLDVDVLCIFQSKGDENGEDQKFGDEVRHDHFKPGYGRGRSRGAALRSLLGPLGAAVGAVVGGIAGSQAGKASQVNPKLKRKLLPALGRSQRRHQISEEKSFSEGACDQEDVHEVEEMTSGPLRYRFTTHRTPTVRLTQSAQRRSADLLRDSRPRPADTPPRCARVSELSMGLASSDKSALLLTRAQKLGPVAGRKMACIGAIPTSSWMAATAE